MAAARPAMARSAGARSGRCRLLHTVRATVDAPFATPTLLLEIPGWSVSDPAISADGATLYFSSTLDDPLFLTNLYTMTRSRL